MKKVFDLTVCILLSMVYVGSIYLAVKLEEIYPLYMKVVLAVGFVGFETWLIYGYIFKGK